MTDAQGKDLVNGQDRSDLLKQAGPRPRFPFARRNRTAIARRSQDGKYWLFVLVSRPNWYFWFFRWQHLWILAIVDSAVLRIRVSSDVAAAAIAICG